MKTQLTYGARYKEGKLSIHKRERLLNEIQAAFGDDVPLIMTIEKASGSTTDRQRKFYFGPVLRAVTRGFYDIGERLSQEDVRALIESQSPVLKKSIPYDGDMKNVQITFSRLDKHGVSEHIEWVCQWAAENLNVFIEDPQDWIDRVYGHKPVLK